MGREEKRGKWSDREFKRVRESEREREREKEGSGDKRIRTIEKTSK